MNRLAIFACLVVVSMFSQELRAGVLYARRPGTEAPVYNLVISKIRTTIDIVGQLAVTHVDEEFFNDNSLRLEGFYAFSLPEGAKVDGLWLWVDGKRLTFIVKKTAEAQRLYDSVVIGTRRDPAILESLGANRFQLKVFPIEPHSSRRVEVQYFHTIPLTPDGTVHYRYPLNMLGYQTTPVEVTDIRINVRSAHRIESFGTSFDNRPLLNRVTRIDESSFTVGFGLENENYTEDYELWYKPQGIFDVFPALAWKDTANPSGDGYFMTWHPIRPDSVGRQYRDLVFVLDASASMDGARITAVRSSVKSILHKLTTDDDFRLVIFSSNVMTFPSTQELVPATAEKIQEAEQFIDRYYQAIGGTNYEAAFMAAFDAVFRPAADKRLLFLTDGEPTLGKLSSAELIQIIRARNTAQVRLHPLVYYSQTIQVVTDIANAFGGKVTVVDQTDNLETVISRLMLDLAVGAMLNPSVQYLNGKTYHVYPLAFSAMTAADQVITTGRYIGDGAEKARLTYTNKDGSPAQMTRDVNFDGMLTSWKQVAAYWAAKRIDDLLDQIKRFGETTELKNSVINLSIQHQVLSPYTAFLVLETNPVDPPTDVEATRVVPESPRFVSIHPVPFSMSRHGVVILEFDMPSESYVTLEIRDVLGRLVRRVFQGDRIPGRHVIRWDGRGESAAFVSTGLYYVTLRAGGISVTRELLVTR